MNGRESIILSIMQCCILLICDITELLSEIEKISGFQTILTMLLIIQGHLERNDGKGLKNNAAVEVIFTEKTNGEE
uniref:Uncharacterized protein n=1 Tax=Salix viminalis TaxID=40686 RepID=A0A6N2L3T3_SALVM